jgi:hypothetical protein
MSNNDHDDEDFEEEPIKLWSYVSNLPFLYYIS